MLVMKGRAPIRRTIQYLKAGKLILKSRIQIFSINYNVLDSHHAGARQFAFWILPQVQYKNPNVQVVRLRNMTPSPFIRCYYEDGKQILIDIDSQTKEDILEHLIKVVGKTQEILTRESHVTEIRHNPANFGVGCEKPCICQMEGQLPCSAVVPLPYHMRGKYKYNKIE